MKSLNKVDIEGQAEQLGTLKNFSDIEAINQLFPDNFSCAWVSLSEGQRLNPHTHDEDSMIIITEGQGFFSANHEFPLTAGDIVYIPSGELHGFRSDSHFWGLSIQFSRTGLYQNPDKPRVRFQSKYAQLLSKNQVLADNFYGTNPTFKIPADTFKQIEKKKALLDSLQVISDHFQRLMYLRVGLCDSPRYQKVFLEHFLEELGHNEELLEERTQNEKVWDPILEAACSWFVNKNYLLDNPGRIIMVQMVLEKCAHLFYSHFSDVLSEGNKSAHIDAHKEADEGHDMIGVPLLQHEPDYKFEEYFKLQEEAWSIMNLYIQRISERIQLAGPKH